MASLPRRALEPPSGTLRVRLKNPRASVRTAKLPEPHATAPLAWRAKPEPASATTPREDDALGRQRRRATDRPSTSLVARAAGTEDTRKLSWVEPRLSRTVRMTRPRRFEGMRTAVAKLPRRSVFALPSRREPARIVTW